MSPDSVIPNPNDTYSYDRYAYCRNNPVNLTDPSGHFWNIIAGAIIGAIMAAINGQNIWVGAAMGAAAAAGFGWAATLHGAAAFGATVFVGAMTGAMSSAIYGGNILQGMLIGAVGAAIGYGVAQWGGTPTAQGGLGLHAFGKGVLSVMSGGTVGGLSSAAMGGDFWQGFTQGAVSAGLSFAANSIANQIQAHRNWMSDPRLRGLAHGVMESAATSSNAQGYVQDDLYFNGKALVAKDDKGKVLGRWPAVSGRPGFQEGEYQFMYHVGPIPEGDWYFVPAYDLQSWDSLPASQHAKSLVGRGEWIGGTSAWGRHRYELHPMDDVVLGQRTATGFFIHGGDEFGSAGCIDLAPGMERFYNYVQTLDPLGVVKVHVKY